MTGTNQANVSQHANTATCALALPPCPQNPNCSGPPTLACVSCSGLVGSTGAGLLLKRPGVLDWNSFTFCCSALKGVLEAWGHEPQGDGEGTIENLSLRRGPNIVDRCRAVQPSWSRDVVHVASLALYKHASMLGWLSVVQDRHFLGIWLLRNLQTASAVSVAPHCNSSAWLQMCKPQRFAV